MRKLTEEEILFEREGRGRFNLRRSCEITPVAASRRTRTGPQATITNRPTRTMPTIGYDRTKYLPKLTKDAMGNDVRMMVQVR